jgi:hypothetical protein
LSACLLHRLVVAGCFLLRYCLALCLVSHEMLFHESELRAKLIGRELRQRRILLRLFWL